MFVCWIFWFSWLWFQQGCTTLSSVLQMLSSVHPCVCILLMLMSVLFAAEAKHGASGPVQFFFICTVHSLSSRREVFAVSSWFSSSVNKSYAMGLPWRQQVVSVCADLLIAAIAFAPEAEFACNVAAHSLPTHTLYRGSSHIIYTTQKFEIGKTFIYIFLFWINAVLFNF